jgi:hypothetical protein
MKKKSFNSSNTEMPINSNFNNWRKFLPPESEESKMIACLIAKSNLIRTD